MTGRTLFTAAAAAEGKAQHQAEAGELGERNVHRRALTAWDTTLFDIAGCHRREISVGLFEVETQGVTHRAETWPDKVRELIDREIETFKAEHPEAAIRCATYGLVKHRDATACCVVLHYVAKERA